MNRACFPKEKHQNSQKWAKFMNYSFLALSLVWFAGATPDLRTPPREGPSLSPQSLRGLQIRVASFLPEEGIGV